MAEEQFLVSPQPPPELNIPKSSNTVKVSVLDPKCRLRIPIGRLLQPEYVGKPELQGPSFSFLIEHPSRKPTLFDLGIRKDWEKFPSYPMWKEAKWYINVETDVASMLKEEGMDVNGGAVGEVIWSHHHWDHVGDITTFPSSTALVLGPGFKDAHLPGYPENQDSSLIGSDFHGDREIREVAFDQNFKIGRFKALDYFGDGSFYLLDTPGHTIGHICGLARTSTNPDTFIFMGGDAAHHGGEFRPTKHLPIPKELKPSPLKRRMPVCPGHLLQHAHRTGSADTPFYLVTVNFANDKKLADWTLDGLGEFDAHEEVLLLMAHDDVVVDPEQIDFYPKTINDWYKKGVGKKIKWMFLEDFEGAAEAKEKGEESFAWGEFKVE